MTIFIVYGISGPLKRVLIDALIYGTSKSIAMDMVNRKGVLRDEKKPYDDFEVVEYSSEDELINSYKNEYIYENEGAKFAVDHKQIELSVNSDRDHFIICNDPLVINQIVIDYNKKVKLLNITFKNYQYALECACEPYRDNVDNRRQKIDMFNQSLEKSGISFDVEIIVENTTRSDSLPELLWKALQPRIDNMYYSWRILLNSNKRSNRFNYDKDLVFEKDYSNVINSSAFRRLQDKAQVFPLEKYDYVRTRLTHSLECSTIAEELGLRALKVIKKHPETGFIDECNKIPGILKTAALLHDMGNPPFGHFGESIIRDWFKDNISKIEIKYNNEKYKLNYILGVDSQMERDLINFEGNAQLFRLITKLTMLDKKFGMDLSYATMSSVIKYPTNSNEIDKKGKSLLKKKLGYYFTETAEFCEVQSSVGLNGKRHPLTFLLEAADDISYLTSDLQDAHRKELIALPYIKSEFIAALTNKDICTDEESQVAIEEIIKLLNVKEENLHDSLLDIFIIEKLCTFIRDRFINDVIKEFDKNYALILSGKFDNELMRTTKATSCINTIIRKCFLEKYVYSESKIIRSQISASRILRKLLDVIVPATLEYGNNAKDISALNSRIFILLSDNYKYVCKEANRKIEESQMTDSEKIKQITFNKILLATDYICGMTDSYAKEIYDMINALV